MRRFTKLGRRRFGLGRGVVHALWLVPGAAALLLACGDDGGAGGAGSGGSGALARELAAALELAW